MEVSLSFEARSPFGHVRAVPSSDPLQSDPIDTPHKEIGYATWHSLTDEPLWKVQTESGAGMSAADQ
jgi:hypothetical protein